MSSSTATPDTFVCAYGWLGRSACEGLPFYKEQGGKRYCVLHYPGTEKGAAFGETLRKRIDEEKFDFSGVWFPDAVNFKEFVFTKVVDFTFAIFNTPATFEAATFSEEVYFSSAMFEAEVNFNGARFNAKASFNSTVFNAGVGFVAATFHEPADFSSAAFRAEASFGFAVFNAAVNFGLAVFRDGKANFLYANFRDYVRFAGNEEKIVFDYESSLRLPFAQIEKPERFSFHTLTLRPHWFVNVDARKFEFVNVDWGWRYTDTKWEIKNVGEKNVSAAHRLLAIACRNLAVNAEDNHRYEEASRFRYMAMETRRLEKWRGFAFWSLEWWYWLASGYGERVWRAFVVLIGVWLVAAALYTGVGFVRWEPRVSSEQEAWEARRDEVGQPLRWQRALTYSLGVMTLQKPEPRPATDVAQAVVMLETILGPVQAALLALAIRRKFMR